MASGASNVARTTFVILRLQTPAVIDIRPTACGGKPETK